MREKHPTRRHAMALAAGVVIGAQMSAARAANRGQSTVRAKDGTRLFVTDYARGAPVLFLHGWSLNGDIWRGQTAAMAASGLRGIAYDRRGHGRSDKPDRGYDYDTLADDLAAVITDLDLKDVTLVAHSMGSGEAVRYLTRHGSSRVARLVLIAPTTPYLLQTPDNPQGLPPAAFDKLRAMLAADYAGYIRASARGGLLPETPQEVVDWVISLALQCSPAAAIACTHSYAETDFRAELPRLATPTLILQGEADTVPVTISGQRTAGLIKGSTLKIYPNGPHGVFVTHADAVNSDLIAFATKGSR